MLATAMRAPMLANVMRAPMVAKVMRGPMLLVIAAALLDGCVDVPRAANARMDTACARVIARARGREPTRRSIGATSR